jgi:hypothetical protein
MEQGHAFGKGRSVTIAAKSIIMSLSFSESGALISQRA